MTQDSGGFPLTADVQSVRKLAKLLGVSEPNGADTPRLDEIIWFGADGFKLKLTTGGGSEGSIWLMPPGDRDCFIRTAHFRVSFECAEMAEGRLAPELEALLNSLPKSLKKLSGEKLEKMLLEDLFVIPADSATPGLPGAGEGLIQNEGENACFRKWNRPDQWHRFFIPEAVARNIEDSFSITNPTVYITHSDFECMFVCSGGSDSIVNFFNYPWLVSKRKNAPDAPPVEGNSTENIPENQPANFHQYTTDLSDMDVIKGGNKKLCDLLDAVVDDDRHQLIKLSSTCVPMVIGDDVDSIVERYRKKCRSPIFFTDQMQESPLDQFIEMLNLRKPAGAINAKKPPLNSVNLVGLNGDTALNELTRMLAEIGVKINSCVLPGMELDIMTRYQNARTQVFMPSFAYSLIYKKIFLELPLKSIFPETPYGVEKTWSWLEAVASAAGRKKRFEKFREDNRGAISEKWKTLVSEAENHRLGLVVKETDILKLTTPSLTWGVPILSMLDEMGFGLDVLAFSEKKTAPELKSQMERAVSAPERLTVTAFQNPDELWRLLREGEFRAVYSDIFFDTRIAGSGKAQFSLTHFEKGIEGAFRTIERLLDVCRLPFYSRYGKYLEEKTT